MRKSLVFAAVMVLALALSARASIVDWNCADDGDGAIVMGTPTWNEVSGEYYLTMSGTQYWYPAHVEGDFTTDTELDPTVWLIETVENQTTFNWTGYIITIGMTKNFTISSVIAPDDWTWVINAPVSGQPIPNDGTGWVGSVVYTYGGPGTEIAIGQSGDFGFKMSFLGSVAFCTEQIPTPEPTTLALLAVGALALIRRNKA